VKQCVLAGVFPLDHGPELASNAVNQIHGFLPGFERVLSSLRTVLPISLGPAVQRGQNVNDSENPPLTVESIPMKRSKSIYDVLALYQPGRG
ncbi:MAG: hypothetical protein ACWGQW_13725, partial [bacterium]